MEFLHAINQSLFLFINADHDDHPSGIVIALLIAEYLTAITLVAVAVYLVWKHRYRRVICLNVLCSLLLGMTATYLICGNQQRCLHFRLLLEDLFEQLSGIVKNVDRHGKTALFLIMTDSCLRIIQAKTKAIRRRKSVNNATISYS